LSVERIREIAQTRREMINSHAAGLERKVVSMTMMANVLKTTVPVVTVKLIIEKKANMIGVMIMVMSAQAFVVVIAVTNPRKTVAAPVVINTGRKKKPTVMPTVERILASAATSIVRKMLRVVGAACVITVAIALFAPASVLVIALVIALVIGLTTVLVSSVLNAVAKKAVVNVAESAVMHKQPGSLRVIAKLTAVRATPALSAAAVILRRVTTQASLGLSLQMLPATTAAAAAPRSAPGIPASMSLVTASSVSPSRRPAMMMPRSAPGIPALMSAVTATDVSLSPR